MKLVLTYIIFVLLRMGKSEDNVAYTDIGTLVADYVVGGSQFKETLIPVSYTNMTMEVTVDIGLASVNSFDELKGYLEISGYLELRWTTLNWTTQSGAGTSYDVSVLITSVSFWKPPLLLTNSIKDTSEIGDATSKIRCNVQSWVCEWKPWIVLRGGCTPDVRFYPFDRQDCSYKVAAWGHTASELTIQPSRSDWDMQFFEDNPEWVIESTTSQSFIKKNVSFIEFKIKLKRIPTYYVISLIAPVVLLTLVNVCVFILPAESGERIGFSITCFLSFVVLLNMIMSFIPASSANLAYLCYYTFIMMVFSCGMSLATVFTLWIHFKPEDSKVPIVLRGFMYVLKCRCFYYTPPPRKGRGVRVQPVKTAGSIWDEDALVSEEAEMKYLEQYGEPEGESKYATWKQVASVMDIFFLLGFLGGQIFYSIGYLLPIILNK